MQKTSEVYPKIYHYTTWDGLLGILKSQSLWATHCKFLNNYSEIIFFKDILVSFITSSLYNLYEKKINSDGELKQKVNNAGGINFVVQHDTEAFVNQLYRVIGEEIYVLSFCGHHKDDNINNNGILSQWRGYGGDGGIVLVFDTKKVEELVKIESESFQYTISLIADIVYSDNKKKLKKELSKPISIIAEDLAKVLNPANYDQIENIDNLKGFLPFVNCISRYKHYGFKEENEVRIVALPTKFNKDIVDISEKMKVKLLPEKERKFRSQNGNTVPYIELFDSKNLDLPIEKIIVGPHKEKENRASALRVMVRNQNIEITCSDIPYVG